MNPRLRYLLSVFVGIGVSVIAFMLMSGLHPTFGQLSVVGLTPAIVSGLIGGAVVAAIAPGNRVALAVGAGCLLSVVLLAFLLRNGFSHGPRPVLLWYWPAWLPLLFAIGGFLSRKVGRAV